MKFKLLLFDLLLYSLCCLQVVGQIAIFFARYVIALVIVLLFPFCANPSEMSKTQNQTDADSSKKRENIAQVSRQNIQELKLLQTFPLDTTNLSNSKIDKIVVDKKTNIAYRVFINVHQKKDKDGRYSLDNSLTTYESGFMLPDGKRVLFDDKYIEEVLDVNNNIITTRTQAYSYEDIVFTEIKRYKFKNNKLKLFAHKRVDSLHIEFMHLKETKNILLYIESVGGGMRFELYSPDLKLINTYPLFETGYSHAVYAQIDSTIVIATNPYDTLKHSIKLTVLDAKTGKVKNENEIKRNEFNVLAIYPFKNMVVIYGSRYYKEPGSRLLGISYNGKILFENKYNFPIAFSGIGCVVNDSTNFLYSNNCVFGKKYPNGRFMGMDIITGCNKWETLGADIYCHDLFPMKYGIDCIRPTIFLQYKDYIILLLGQIQDSDDQLGKNVYRRNYLCVLDKEGNVVYDSDKIKDDFHFCATINNNHLIISTETQIYHYELPE